MAAVTVRVWNPVTCVHDDIQVDGGAAADELFELFRVTGREGQCSARISACIGVKSGKWEATLILRYLDVIFKPVEATDGGCLEEVVERLLLAGIHLVRRNPDPQRGFSGIGSWGSK